MEKDNSQIYPLLSYTNCMKLSEYEVFSGLHFPVFVRIHFPIFARIQCQQGKILTRKNSAFRRFFHAMITTMK